MIVPNGLLSCSPDDSDVGYARHFGLDLELGLTLGAGA
jgi:hypothetical protein